jgi:hypothetical protein
MSSPPSIVPEFSDGGGGGSGGVQTVSAGTNITVTGTSTDPVINNNGVLTVTGGTNITVTGTANNPIINSSASLPVGILSTASTAITSLTTTETTILSLPFTLTQTSNIYVAGKLGLQSISNNSAWVIMSLGIDTAPIPNTTSFQTVQVQGSGTVYEGISSTGFTNRPAGSYTLKLRAYAVGVPNGTIGLTTGHNAMQLLINLA